MIKKLFKRAPISLSISGGLLVLFLWDSLMVQMYGSRVLDQFLVFHTSKPLQFHRYPTYALVSVSFTHLFYSAISLIIMGYFVENKMSQGLRISSALVSIVSLPLLYLIFHGLDPTTIIGNSAVAYCWSGILLILILKKADLFSRIELLFARICVGYFALGYVLQLYYVIFNSEPYSYNNSLTHFGLIIAALAAWGSTRFWYNQLQPQN